MKAGICFYTPQTEWVRNYIDKGKNAVIVETKLNSELNIEVFSNADRNGFFMYKGKNRIEK